METKSPYSSHIKQLRMSFSGNILILLEFDLKKKKTEKDLLKQLVFISLYKSESKTLGSNVLQNIGRLGIAPETGEAPESVVGWPRGRAEYSWLLLAAPAMPLEKSARRSLEEVQEGKGWSSTDVASRPALRVCLDFRDLLKKED